jgi:hypothetical protein
VGVFVLLQVEDKFIVVKVSRNDEGPLVEKLDWLIAFLRKGYTLLVLALDLLYLVSSFPDLLTACNLCCLSFESVVVSSVKQVQFVLLVHFYLFFVY